jgi:hypothetical protein
MPLEKAFQYENAYGDVCYAYEQFCLLLVAKSLRQQALIRKSDRVGKIMLSKYF